MTETSNDDTVSLDTSVELKNRYPSAFEKPTFGWTAEQFVIQDNGLELEIPFESVEEITVREKPSSQPYRRAAFVFIASGFAILPFASWSESLVLAYGLAALFVMTGTYLFNQLDTGYLEATILTDEEAYQVESQDEAVRDCVGVVADFKCQD